MGSFDIFPFFFLDWLPYVWEFVWFILTLPLQLFGYV